MNTIRALNGNVILTQYTEKVKLGSGILEAAPQARQEQQSEGLVHDIENFSPEPQFGKGDRVFYRATNAQRAVVDGVVYLIVPVKDIIAKVAPIETVTE